MSLRRLRLRLPILLPVIAGLLAVAAGTLAMTGCATQPSTTDLVTASSPACRTVRIPVTVPNLTAPAQLTGDLCTPATATNVVLLLVGGGGENADYWNLPGLPGNSLVDAATRQGYATLAVDRLGTGRSTLPPSSTLVTYPAQVSTIAQVAAALRTDRTRFGRTWPTVIGIGHSLGSGTLVGVAADQPQDLAALVLTGYGAAVTPQTLQLDQRYQVPARTVSPRWSALDPGYVTVVPSAVEQIGLLYPPGTSAADLAATEAHQGTLSTTELATRPQGAAAVAQGARITVPVLVADGQYDRHYCEANPVGAAPASTPQCRDAAAFHAYTQALLPHACLATSLIAGSGHAIQEQTAAPSANARYLDWLRTTVTDGHARCAGTGRPTGSTS